MPEAEEKEELKKTDALRSERCTRGGKVPLNSEGGGMEIGALREEEKILGRLGCHYLHQ